MSGVAPSMLDGSLKDTAPLRMCDKHGQPASPAGGVQLGRRWLCAACWRSLSLKKKT